MRAAVLTSAEPTLEVTDLPDPTPGPGEALLEVTACGICGSDLHIASVLAPHGSVLGHEIAGVVRGVGAGVDAGRWKVGTPVAARPLVGCGSCRHCASGRPDHCDQFALVGLQRLGGFAELTTVSAGELFTLPTNLAGDEQALVEPMAVARRALRRVDLRPGEDVAVLGAGPIGLAVIAWARAMGAGRILASEPSAARRDLAVALGADLALDPTSGMLTFEAADAGFVQPPVVVECSGRPGVIADAIGLVDVDGRVGVVGICTQEDTFMPYFGLAKEVDLRFCIYYGAEDFTDTIDAFASGSLDPRAMITETIGLDALPGRFAALAHEPDGGKVVLRP